MLFFGTEMSFCELLPFLSNESKRVRHEAVRVVLGLSENISFIEFVKRDLKRWSQLLLSLSIDDCLSEALSALINLTADVAFARHMGQLPSVSSICDALTEAHLLGPDSTENLLIMLLTNITRESIGVRSLLERDLFVMRLFNFYGSDVKGVPGRYVSL